MTTNVSLPSRYLVLPLASQTATEQVGVSVRIEDESERQRLRAMVQDMTTGEHGGGFILRTNSEGVAEAELEADVGYLDRLWDSIRDDLATASPGTLVYEELPLALRAI